MSIEKRVRSDKKRHVAPTISLVLKDTIYRLSYITGTPVKDVAEAICISGMDSKKVIGLLSVNFRRDVRLRNTLYLGDLSCASVSRKVAAGKTERISIRFKAPDYENINTLAYALDATPSRAIALLLDASIRDTDFLNEFVHDHLVSTLDARRMGELKKIMYYLRENNPYDEALTWTHLLMYIVDEMKDGAQTVADSIGKYLTKLK